MSIPETVMNERCAGCAFRPGTEAATYPWTVAQRNLCVMVGSPFECHGDAGAGHLCRGFVDAFEAKVKNGDYDRLPQWKKDLSLKMLDIIGEVYEADRTGGPMPTDDVVQRAVEESASGTSP